MSSERKSIAFSDLNLNQVHLELRTTPKFLLWDRAGTIWTQILDKYPRLTFSQAEPNKIVFSLDNKYVFSTLIDYSSTPHTTILGSAYQPHPALKEFAEIMKLLTEIIQNNLEITDYHRIGLRLVYFKDYPDRESAIQAFLSTNLLRVPDSPNFGVKGSPTLPEYSMRLEEKDKKGITIRIKVDTFTYDFTPPFEWQESPAIHKKYNRLMFDLDNYTLGTVAIGQFNVIEWVSQTLHVVNRDSDKFLRGV